VKDQKCGYENKKDFSEFKIEETLLYCRERGKDKGSEKEKGKGRRKGKERKKVELKKVVAAKIVYHVIHVNDVIAIKLRR
jgi:hypothetical protein